MSVAIISIFLEHYKIFPIGLPTSYVIPSTTSLNPSP